MHIFVALFLTCTWLQFYKYHGTQVQKGQFVPYDLQTVSSDVNSSATFQQKFTWSGLLWQCISLSYDYQMALIHVVIKAEQFSRFPLGIKEIYKDCLQK